MPKVDQKRTRPGATRSEMWGALFDAIAGGLRAIGAELKGAAVELLLAHILLEHGRDLDGLWNNNVGNVKWQPWQAEKNPQAKFYVLEDGFRSTDRYQAHETLDQGIGPYLFELTRPKRAAVYDAATVGDVEAFARNLLATEYIGRDPNLTPNEQYRQLVANLRQLRHEIREHLTST